MLLIPWRCFFVVALLPFPSVSERIFELQNGVQDEHVGASNQVKATIDEVALLKQVEAIFKVTSGLAPDDEKTHRRDVEKDKHADESGQVKDTKDENALLKQVEAIFRVTSGLAPDDEKYRRDVEKVRKLFRSVARRMYDSIDKVLNENVPLAPMSSAVQQQIEKVVSIVADTHNPKIAKSLGGQAKETLLAMSEFTRQRYRRIIGQFLSKKFLTKVGVHVDEAEWGTPPKNAQESLQDDRQDSVAVSKLAREVLDDLRSHVDGDNSQQEAEAGILSKVWKAMLGWTEATSPSRPDSDDTEDETEATSPSRPISDDTEDETEVEPERHTKAFEIYVNPSTA
eukprot:TRINITY_DN2445_c0_g1_i2.p1 TRINITY_DN2445_c0_g1~~TRINITY_DN2445_c0_g1_i2.p1  ORF type:complete len:341 (-),score=63.38 TRINITY_DN2445_c0_g1_i2:108-1130(-)